MALGPGSIAFVGLNTDGNDNLAFVALEAIAAGTVIYFQDNEWNGSAIGAGGAFNTGESAWSWTATSEIAAGAIVTIDSIGTGTISANTGSVAFSDASNRGIANSNEVVYAFVGSSASAPTAFLTAATNNTFAAAGSIANTGLTAGANAVEFNSGHDVFAFTGGRGDQASFGAYAAIINNPANWISQDGSGDQSSDTIAPDLPFSTEAFTLAGGDTTAPTLSSSVPADDAGSVAANADIVLNFDEAVQKGAGNILIKLLADDSVVQTIDVASADVSVSGSTVTINPPADLAPGTAHYVEVPAGAFKDLAGNDFAGISGPAALNFTTTSVPAEINGIRILDQAESLQGTSNTTPTNKLSVERIGGLDSGFDVGGAESLAYDAVSQQVFITNAAQDRIDIVDLSVPSAPVKVGEIALGAVAGYGEVNSVAIKNGVVAVAIQNIDGGEAGFVRLYDTAGSFIKQITVGVQPDQLTFSPDGSLLLVANEAERYVDRSGTPTVENAAGTVSIIDMSGGAAAAAIRNTVGFTALDGSEAVLEEAGLNINDGTSSPVGNNLLAAPDSTPSQDIEPEYIAVSADGTKAYVTLQEVNAVAIIDLTDGVADRPEALLPLGTIDRSLTGNEGDFSDRDGPGSSASISIDTAPLKSMLQPDAIATFDVAGVTYFITANEGDSRIMNDPLVGDPDGFNEGRASTVEGGLPADYARLNVDTALSSPGDFYTFGGRGISIFRQEADGSVTKVRETGGEFEKIIASLPDAATVFNGQDGGGFDSRSDNKGPEPEGVDVAQIGDKTYAFVSLERVGGLMVYDVSDPANAQFVRYVPATVDDMRPEVTKVISAADSPTGRTLILTANEESGSLTVYEADNYTRIHDVQGTSAASTMVGQTVTVEAIVVGDFQNGDGDTKRNLNGFYLQEENADQDGNALTSEGMFVFQGGLGGVPDVGLGDRVRVTGTVSEFNGSTQLTATSVTLVEADAVADVNTMAATVDLSAATAIQRPGTVANSTTSFHANLEAYEGMLVEFSDTLRVTEQFDLDRFVEVRLAAGDMPVTFTHENEPDVAGNAANLADIAARTIYYEDGLSTQNSPIGNLDGFGPVYSTANAPQMGDSVDDLTGVLDFAFNQFRVRAVEDGANVFTDTNPRTAEPEDVGGTLKVASFNVLNYFKSIDTIQEASGAPDNPADNTPAGHDPRGADSTAEFERQTEKLVNVLMELDADVLGLIEVENDFLPGSSGNAIEHLVNALNAEIGSTTYSWVDPGQQFVGGDAIAVGFIYKTGMVKIADGTSVATLTDADFPGLGLDGLLAQSTVGGVFNGVNTSRVPVAVTFEEIATGGEFTAVVNHLKSKSGTGTGNDADQLDGQGNWQQQRELAATALTEWLEANPTGSDDSDVVLLGDFNAYFREDTIDIVTGAGFENLQDTMIVDPYSFVFDGQRGALDYIFTNSSLTGQVTGITEWHINADEADALDYNLDFGRDPDIFDEDALVRVSDHDPLIMGLDLTEDPIVPAYTLQLLHLADGEAGLLASTTAPSLAALVDAFDDDYANTLILAGGDNWLPGPFLAAGTDLSVKSTLNEVSGSTISADPNAQIPVGAVDIAIHNAIGVEVSSIGNHEWDLGSRVFRDSFTPGNGWVGADFVHISANLDFSGDADVASRFTNTVDGDGTTTNPGATNIAEASSLKGRIAPAVVITEGGEKIGFVGATTQILEAISSPTGTEVEGFPGGPGANGEVDDMDLLAAQLQPIINELIAEGVNKIVLQAHLQQIANEVSLASKLRGVDVILAAGSNTRLGDADDEAVSFPGHNADFAGDYPLTVTDLDGKTTLIVNTDNEYTYMGRLVVDFDENGDIILDSLTANQSINGAYASTEENVAEAWGVDVADLATTAFADGTKGDKVEKLVDAVDAVIQVKDGNVFGFTDVYLEGERGIIRNEETNLGDLSADANAYALKQALGSAAPDAYVVSLKNGGGIRAQIGTISPPDPVDGTVDKLPPPANPDAGKPEGGVSQLDVENSLRFNNRLMAYDTDAAGLKAILEHGVALLGNQGRFPQIGGVQFSYDPDLPAGSRILSIALIDEFGNQTALLVDNGVVLPGAPSLITVVTLNFTANGGDGYPVKANGSNFRFLLDDGTLGPAVDESANFTASDVVPANALGEQDAFGDYMQAVHGTQEKAYDQADTAASEDLRIENLNVRSDAVIPDGAIIGTDAGETLNGTNSGDHIFALGGDDIVNARLGDDFANAGDGNDFVRGNGGDDTLLGGAGDDDLRGEADNDTLLGGSGIDRLDGGAGADEMRGGSGDDTYYVDEAADQVIEMNLDDSDTGGLDTVRSGISYTLGAFVENLFLTGTAANGTGNDLNNAIVGNAEANTLIGHGGDDRLNGGVGADTMIGGTGNDNYYVDNGGDGVTEAAGQGIDRVVSSITYLLGASVENLMLSGTAEVDGFGNELDNVVTGNDATNTLSGGAGNDRLRGGGADDTLIGGSGNDQLDGGTGADIMIGGLGDDKYVVDDAGDVVVEAADGGMDTVQSSISYALGSNVENLQLVGDAAIDGTGNALSNAITGNAQANILSGGSGNDRLNGGEGADTMIGGSDDDVYVIDDAGDTVIEAFDEGTDTVQSSISATLGANVEKLTLTGDAAIDGTGNGLDNAIVGNAQVNVLDGGAGLDILRGNTGADVLIGGEGNDNLNGGDDNDLLIGGIGDDVLTGGNGVDVIGLRTGFGADRVTDFSASDFVDLRGFGYASGQAVVNSFIQVGNNVILGLPSGDQLTLQNVQKSSLNASQFIVADAEVVALPTDVQDHVNQYLV